MDTPAIPADCLTLTPVISVTGLRTPSATMSCTRIST